MFATVNRSFLKTQQSFKQLFVIKLDFFREKYRIFEIKIFTVIDRKKFFIVSWQISDLIWLFQS